MRRTGFAIAGMLGISLWASAAAGAPPGACRMDFEGLPAGTVVTELSVGNGINGCNASGSVAVTSQNSIFADEAAIVFDSDCPVILDPFSDCDSRDVDLGTPNEDFGGPGVGEGGEAGSPFQNDVALGKILVLALDKVDSNGDDLVDDPDDADVSGSYRFDFTGINPNGVSINEVQLIDVEFDEGENPALVTLIVPGGGPAAFAINDTGNNGVATIPLIGIEGVTEMLVEVKGSSGFGGVVFNEKKAGRACWATFGGFDSAFVGPEGQKIASFGGNVGPPPSGHLNIVKHATGEHLRVADVEVESCERIEEVCPNSAEASPGQPGGKKGFDINVLNFVGTGDLDGEEVDVEGRLIDCGEPQGKKNLDPDRFEIYADGMEFVADVLGGGNVQLHPPVGKP
jgi:hypothetical protein